MDTVRVYAVRVRKSGELLRTDEGKIICSHQGSALLAVAHRAGLRHREVEFVYRGERRARLTDDERERLGMPARPAPQPERRVLITWYSRTRQAERRRDVAYRDLARTLRSLKALGVPRRALRVALYEVTAHA